MKRKKPYRYTILTVILALLFSLGSMVGMSMLLKERERHLLAEKGKVQEDVPVREWQGDGNALTVEQMEEAIDCWGRRTAMKIHDPAKGQISMEEAIQEGEAWLSEMDLGWEGETSVFATLAAPVREGSAEAAAEPYFSFWWLEFSGSGRRFFLYINAVAGKVWEAELYWEQAPQAEMSQSRLRKFVLLAGLEPAEAESKGEWAGKGQSRIVYRRLDIGHSQLRAWESWFSYEAFPHNSSGNQELVNLQGALRLVGRNPAP